MSISEISPEGVEKECVELMASAFMWQLDSVQQAY